MRFLFQLSKNENNKDYRFSAIVFVEKEKKVNRPEA